MAQNITIKQNSGTSYDTLYPSIDVTSLSLDASQISSGVLGVSNGGTGQTTIAGIKDALGISSTDSAPGIFYAKSFEINQNSIENTVT